MPTFDASPPQILCFGEALWDTTPGGMVPGGAPLNVAVRLRRLGAPVSLLSRVGHDDLGRKLLDYLAGQGLDTSRIQIDERHPTGRVRVDLSDPHEARYEIERPAAWDFIEFEPGAAGGAAGLVFGSLAVRNEVSRATLERLLDEVALRVFDVNLRPPFVDREYIEALLRRADWTKLNDHELDLIGEWNGLVGEREQRVRALADRYALDTVCVTLGGDGALLWHDGAFVRQRGFRVAVMDTIGCGDSFLACWLWSMLAGEESALALRRACALGALVATREGANPDIGEQQIRDLIRF